MQKLSFFCLAILVVAFAFVVPTAMAAEFGVSMSLAPHVDDVSFPDGIQVPVNSNVDVYITFDKVVAVGATTDFSATDVTYQGLTEHGGIVVSGSVANVSAVDPMDGRTFRFTVPRFQDNVRKANLFMARHAVHSADPSADLDADGAKTVDGKSAQATFSIEYVLADQGSPQVYSIERTGANLRAKVTEKTVDVVITLSEAPKEFNKDYIDVTNATWGEPEILVPRQIDVGVLEQDYLTRGETLKPTRFPAESRDGYEFQEEYVVSPDEADALEVTYMMRTTPQNGDATDSEANATGPPEEVAPVDYTADGFTFDVASTAGPPMEPAEGASDRDWDRYWDHIRLWRTADAYVNFGRHLAAYGEVLDSAQDAAWQAYQEAVTEYNNDLNVFLRDRGIQSLPTGRNNKLERYLLTITPKYVNENPIVVKVKAFEGRVLPSDADNRYTPPRVAYEEGVDKLTIQVGAPVLKPGTSGLEVVLAKEQFIPSDGYLVVADDAAGSAIINPGGAKDAPKLDRTPEGLKYNLYAIGLPNLASFLVSGGVIDVVSPMDLTITEVMWGEDASLADISASQWIELHNSGTGANTADDDANTAADEATRLIFYTYGQAPPLNADGTLPAGVKDRIGTIEATGTIWALTGKGQGGRTGTGETTDELIGAVASRVPLISMSRVIDVTGKAEDGTLQTSWVASATPINFDLNATGVRLGSPGAEHIVTAAEILAAQNAAKAAADAATASAAAAAATLEGTGTVPQNGQIYISEIMVDRGNNLPQWIEIANGSRTEEVNLSGWTLTVNNAAADADVSAGASITFTIPAGTKIGMFGQNVEPSTILVVTEAGRNSLSGALAKGQVLNLWESNQDELILAGVSKRRYSLISQDAFLITLAPPAPTKTTVAATATVSEKAAAKAADARALLNHKAASDVVGNLGADGAAAWVLPMNMEGGRSSIIRKHIEITRGPAAPEDGDMMEGWVLAADTSFARATHISAASYYGAANDVGTPGFRAGGALPVELSGFSPARDKVTGQVVITWSTQSELNNAGFFIKRSQQADGEFKVINATMIPGAGTTSEKQSYTFTDSTANPNIVYYYQIEDVSFDGQRQTLTRGIRLKGHVGAVGKATTLWGELKSFE